VWGGCCWRWLDGGGCGEGYEEMGEGLRLACLWSLLVTAETVPKVANVVSYL
jgi:hypothetical protein